MTISKYLITAVFATFATVASAQKMPPEFKAKVDARAKLLKAWSTDPVIVGAVRAFNANPPGETRSMTQDKWKALSAHDPIVTNLAGNALAKYLRGKQDLTITECFVSGSDGTKVAFLDKTTNWSHSDKDKHKVPMSGGTFIGPPLVDESSGAVEVQIGVPVIDDGKPIGSIVIGLGVSKL